LQIDKSTEATENQTRRNIAIKKYTGNGRFSLHESVIVDDIPQFVVLDEDKEPIFKNKIETPTDKLIPSDTQNPLPYVFESEHEFSEYLQKAKEETLDSLFSCFEYILREYVNVDEHYYVLLTADLIWSYFQDKFGYTHNNIFVGDNGSGKNSALLVLRFLGYRCFYIISAHAANYFTEMGNKEEGQITIAEDEAEDMADDKDKRNAIKAGYASGGSVPRIELEGKGGRRQDSWLVYCHKWFAMEELPDNKNIKGILDRSFVLKFVPGDVKYNIKDVVKTGRDPKFQSLYDELMHVRKLMFCYRVLHYDDVILDVELNVKARSAELTKPLIRLFRYSPLALKRILDALSRFIDERNETKKNTFESKLYEVIACLIEERRERIQNNYPISEDQALDELVFTNQTIKEKCKYLWDGSDIPDKVGMFYSAEFGQISQKRISSTLKSKFKARPIRAEIHGKTTRCFEFKEEYLTRLRSYYDVPDCIQILDSDG
jgi:hypothetical protein